MAECSKTDDLNLRFDMKFEDQGELVVFIWKMNGICKIHYAKSA